MDKIAALVAYEIALTAIAKNIFQLHKVVALQLINLNIHTRTDLHCHSVQFLWQSSGDVNLQIYKWKNVTQGYISYYCPDSLTCPRMVMHFSNLFSSTDGDHCGWTGLHADWILIPARREETNRWLLHPLFLFGGWKRIEILSIWFMKPHRKPGNWISADQL